MKITVIGTGYVGLVSGVCFSDLGNHVTCVDNNPAKLDILKQHKVPFYEPGLEERLVRSAVAGRLTFTDSIDAAIQDSEIIFSAVGTPQTADGSADLTAVYAVAHAVCKAYKELGCNTHKVYVNKSTVPVGTGDIIAGIRDDYGLTQDQLSILSNPEFLREGTAVYDFYHPDRIVLGSSCEKALSKCSELYDPLYRSDTPIVKTTLKTAELSKYASNAFLATKISFINEMSNLCELTGSDVKDLAKIMGMDGRIGRYFLHPGPGYGGSCFPKDTQAIIHTADQLGYDLKVVKAVEAVNERQKLHIMTHLTAVFSSLQGKTIALLGLAFKPNTDDTRDASALVIIDALLAAGATVRAFDPEVPYLPEIKSDQVMYATDSYDAVTGADAVLLVTEWNMFRELDLTRLKSEMKQPYFFDLRNVYAPEKLEQAGFTAYVIGRQLIETTIAADT
ncbi:UDP-glucose 6-dehydrogenase [Candidatus Marinamargulisbacteria bacterium SCGC AG-414-C22]|nr:UDP-glucose 6-dehydrogenase [Candidatus Marinamargulisbacteria bacterium SCGC AG-414-C22]